MLEDAAGHGGIAALLRDQLRWVIRGEFGEEEKVGGGGGFAEQPDALTDQPSDGEQLFRRRLKAGDSEEGLEQAAELIDGEGAEMLGVEPDGFGVEGISFGKIDDGVGAVDVFEGEERANLIDGKEFAGVLGRPAEQAEKVDEGAC